jgi:hypothetical protein
LFGSSGGSGEFWGVLGSSGEFEEIEEFKEFEILLEIFRALGQRFEGLGGAEEVV